jgi:hypothetical protein
MRMYDSAEPTESILSAYDSDMVKRGWTESPLPEDELPLNDTARAFVKDGRALFVAINETPEGKSGVTLLEMGTAGFVHAEVEDEP